MRALPLSQGEVDGQLYCFMCRRTLVDPLEQLYSLTTEDDEEWDNLELVLGESSNWAVCKGCLGIIEEQLGYEIIISTVEEVMEIESFWIDVVLGEEGYKILRDNLDAIEERKCPSCGNSIRERFDYMIYDESWWSKRNFRSITLSCNNCDFSQTLGPPITDVALGYFLTGTILGFDGHFMKFEVAPSYKEMRERYEKKEEPFLKPLIIKHMVDLDILGVYLNLMELVEILVIADIVVRVSG